LTPYLKTSECDELGFAAAIYPCTGFIPAMLSMQDSYRGLKEGGSDLEFCKGNAIVNFFEQLGLKDSWDFDDKIEKFSREEVKHTTNEQES